MDYYHNAHAAIGWWGNTAPMGTTLDPKRYFTSTLPAVEAARSTDQSPPQPLPLQCMLRAGETIYIPSGWWHTVLNTEDAVAITGNFMADYNAEQVLEELNKRPQKQVS
jgi:hypothetical protein